MPMHSFPKNSSWLYQTAKAYEKKPLLHYRSHRALKPLAHMRKATTRGFRTNLPTTASPRKSPHPGLQPYCPRSISVVARRTHAHVKRCRKQQLPRQPCMLMTGRHAPVNPDTLFKHNCLTSCTNFAYCVSNSQGSVKQQLGWCGCDYTT
jgi:hypothetical protein